MGKSLHRSGYSRTKGDTAVKYQAAHSLLARITKDEPPTPGHFGVTFDGPKGYVLFYAQPPAFVRHAATLRAAHKLIKEVKQLPSAAS
jgi:hypothetical protein